MATEVDVLPVDPYVRVGVDGVDGAGKSCFAAELTTALRQRGRVVVHASIDGFHQPRALRHARGASDPEGFYRDSYDLAALQAELLEPLAPAVTASTAPTSSTPAPTRRTSPSRSKQPQARS
ncbi:nucleoside/nucleotide kinase family protein [Kineococcus sp. SYSU DK018]|uniref:hypothetical protein n=1 Tax=Kineococcus sp. SYSU DK018 TaxID=3383139 RepID=UPI003D7E5042